MRDANGYAYEVVQSADSSFFTDFFRIYEESLPLRERKGKAEIAAAVASPEYQTLVVRRAETVLGFSILFLVPELGLGLLEYMAVSSSARGAGVGEALFRQTVDQALLVDANITIVLEVDAPRGAKSTDRDTERRQSFYRRLGCRRVAGLSYLLPLPGHGPAPEMDVFLWRASSASTLPKSLFALWLQTIYARVYRVSADDTRVAAMLTNLDDPLLLD